MTYSEDGVLDFADIINVNSVFPGPINGSSPSN